MSLGKSKYDAFFKRSKNSAECVVCTKIVTFSTSAGTNSLKYHLSTAHPDDLKKLKDEELVSKRRKMEETESEKLQSTIPFATVSRTVCKVGKPHGTDDVDKHLTKWSESGARTKEIEDAIMKMIAVDALPLMTVEKQGFVQLMKTVAPKFVIKSRKYFSETMLPKLEIRIKDRIKTEMNGVQHFAITSDGWSSKDGKHHLLAITAHWIDNSFSPKFVVLGSCAIKGKHSADNFINMFNRSLEEFGLKRESVTAIVRDGHRAMEAFTNRMNIIGIHCYSHNLQLVVRDFIETIDNMKAIIEKLKKYVRKISKSALSREIFVEIQKEQNMPSHMLKKETEVRWSSMYLMLQSFVTNRRAITIIQLDHPELCLPEIYPEEWDKMMELLEVLKTAADTTKSIQSRFDAPLSVIIPSLRVMQYKMENSLNDDTSETKANHVQKFIEILQERTESYHSNNTLRTSTFCDPRFKDCYFTKSHRDHILGLLRSNSENISINNDVSNEELPIEVVEKPISLFTQFLMSNSTLEPPKEDDSCEEELKEYLRTPPIPVSDPYDFWKSQPLLPQMRKLAQKYLSIPSTSSESERLFSLSGLICTPRRSCMKPKTLDQLTFCSANMKVFGDI